MERRDEKYLLHGFIEMDKGFFEGHRKKDEEVLVASQQRSFTGN